MKKLLLVVALGLAAWFAYSRVVGPTELSNSASTAAESIDDPSAPTLAPQQEFVCDGRTHCSQMTSCEEAEYFLENCPGVKMDGNNDGEPCETQWCGN